MAQIDRPFTPRVSFTVNGEIRIVGNNSLTCSTSKGSNAAKTACPDARNRVGPRLDNDDFFMDDVHLADDRLSAQNSSAATLTLPTNPSILWAGLYWQAEMRQGVAAPSTSRILRADRRGYVQFQTPTSGGFVEIQSTQSDEAAHGNGQTYQEFADVTQLVRLGGAGQYVVADMQTATGEDRAAGWALVVVLQNPDEPLRRLIVFDGAATVAPGFPVSIAV